ncbi:MAG: glycosyltransferase family 39 protein [Deltaproteobacteria bacterium]
MSSVRQLEIPPPEATRSAGEAELPAALPLPAQGALWSPLGALALATLVRALVFPFAWNLYGDAPARVETVLRWLQAPFFLRSFEGARQFGPLNVYLLGALERLFPNPFVAPRLLSFALGSLTAWPLYRLAEARFGRRAAALSTWAFAVYGLHVQASTTAASEGVFLFFLAWGLVFLDRGLARSPRWLLGAALAMAAACATRYDGWLYAPLSWLLCWPALRAGRLSWRAAVAYALGTIAVPLFLLWGNWVDMGDPLYLPHYIDADHLRNAALASAHMGRAIWTGYCLTFWPSNLAVELTPAVAGAILLAGREAVATRRARGLLWLALVPAALFTFRGAFLLEFHPLARFTIPTAVLLLPYAGRGFELLFSGRSPSARAALAAGSIALALAFPAYLAWRTIGRGDAWADALRPISPVSTLPPDLEAAARALAALGPGRLVLVDSDAAYEDIPVRFYARRPPGELLSWREKRDRARLSQGAVPDLVVLMPHSDLVAAGQAWAGGDSLIAFGQSYRLRERDGAVTLYERSRE